MSERLEGQGAGLVHLVEDDASARKATARSLGAAGYQVTTYETGAEFLAARADSGCVILDLQLPGGSGLDVQRQLAAAGQPLPVLRRWLRWRHRG